MSKADHGWTHDGLAADLMDARHLADEIAIERLALRGGQVDVAAMRLSWSAPSCTAYEVKISRADFLSDIRAEKWRNYLPDVERLIFAVPSGMVELDEVPAECGLVVRGQRGWYGRRRARRQQLTPQAHVRFVQAILFRHYPADWDGAKRARENILAAAAIR